jgi:hypothetical protein
VKILGNELRYLRLSIGRRPDQGAVPAEIWEICPKLEDFDGSFHSPPATPPIGHPIHTITLSPFVFDPKLEEILAGWTNLRTIRIDNKWEFWEAPLRPSWSHLIEWTALRCLSLQDRSEESLTEYLARAGVKVDYNG